MGDAMGHSVAKAVSGTVFSKPPLTHPLTEALKRLTVGQTLPGMHLITLNGPL